MNIPNECIIHIADYLTLEGLRNLSQCDKYFNELLRNKLNTLKICKRFGRKIKNRIKYWDIYRNYEWVCECRKDKALSRTKKEHYMLSPDHRVDYRCAYCSKNLVTIIKDERKRTKLTYIHL